MAKKKSSNEVAESDHKAEVLMQMEEPTQRLAVARRKELEKTGTTILQSEYRFGMKLAAVVENSSRYGDSAIEQLASYLNETPSTLYTLINMVQTFSLDEILAEMQKVCDDGSLLNVSHFKELSRVSTKRERKTLLNRARRENLSAQDVRREIAASSAKSGRRNSGRSMAAPTSPKAGIRQMANQCRAVVKRSEALSEVMEHLETCDDASEYDDVLMERLEEAAQDAAASELAVKNFKTRLTRLIERGKRVQVGPDGTPFFKATATLVSDSEDQDEELDDEEDEELDDEEEQDVDLDEELDEEPDDADTLADPLDGPADVLGEEDDDEEEWDEDEEYFEDDDEYEYEDDED